MQGKIKVFLVFKGSSRLNFFINLDEKGIKRSIIKYETFYKCFQFIGLEVQGFFKIFFFVCNASVDKFHVQIC